MAEVDYSNIQLLLDTLVPNLPENVASLLTDNSFKNGALEFLGSLFDQDSTILTSSAPTADTANGRNSLDGGNQNNQLVNEIAELDSSQKIIEDKLKKTVVKSSNDIIESRFQLNNILQKFEKDFDIQLKEISGSLEDALTTEDFKNIQSNQSENQNESSNSDVEYGMNKIDFKSLKHISKKLRSNSPLSALLSNINSITDILELPSLAGACVKSGYYHDTLEISSYTRRLAIRYPNVDIIKKVEAGVKQEIVVMLIGLLKLLKTDLKQSNIVKIISYLRRIYPFNTLSQNSGISLTSKASSFILDKMKSSSGKNNNDDEFLLKFSTLELDSNSMLRRIFLQSRYQFISSELEALVPLKEHSVEKFLKRVIELIREHCFSSIITYQSVFPDDEQFSVRNNNRGNSRNNGDADDSDEDDDDDDDDDDDLFSESNQLINEFITQVINKFVTILCGNLPFVEEQQAKDSLILQTIYCSQSLGRVGGEFGSLLLNEVQSNIVYKDKVITEGQWFKILKKQRTLIKSLNKV